jgi:NAD(P)-dependent dehydrogenase (short-subunit alcohol dehydrogenase family)
MPLLEGEVALVTGAADGIGLAIARRFAAEGACVALADIRAEAAEDAAAALRDEGHDAIALAMDVADEDSTEAAVHACAEQFGGLDIAVANAGIIHLAPALDFELAQFRRVLDVNLVGAFLTCRAAARHMVQAGTAGRLILTSSLFGIRGGRGNAAYSASKFGAIGLAECLAADLAPHNILVNAVCPGQIDTPLLRKTVAEKSALPVAGGVRDVAQEMLAGIPLGRLGEPDEVSDVFVFLASPLARYVTGQSLVVDGGMTVG